jgi:hypothetical protein
LSHIYPLNNLSSPHFPFLLLILLFANAITFFPPCPFFLLSLISFPFSFLTPSSSFSSSVFWLTFPSWPYALTFYPPLLPFCIFVIVSLPREWFQEIKRMMMLHSTHGLFFYLHTRISFIFTHAQLYDTYKMSRQLLLNPLQIIKNPDWLRRPDFCSWWRIPI